MADDQPQVPAGRPRAVLTLTPTMFVALDAYGGFRVGRHEGTNVPCLVGITDVGYAILTDFASDAAAEAGFAAVLDAVKSGCDCDLSGVTLAETLTIEKGK